MNTIDYIVLFLLLIGTIVGLKRGFIVELSNVVKGIVSLYVAYIFRDEGALLLSSLIKFPELEGIWARISVIEIYIYQIAAFFIIWLFVRLLFMIVTKTLEESTKGVPVISQTKHILGGVLGFLKMYIIVFIVLFFLSLPFMKFESVKESLVTDYIVNKTPYLSNFMNNIKDTVTEMIDTIDENEEKTDEEINFDILKMMIDSGMVNIETIEKILGKENLDINNLTNEEISLLIDLIKNKQTGD